MSRASEAFAKYWGESGEKLIFNLSSRVRADDEGLKIIMELAFIAGHGEGHTLGWEQAMSCFDATAETIMHPEPKPDAVQVAAAETMGARK